MQPLIRLGDSGPEVRDVQRRLVDLGYGVDDDPARFGQGTHVAVRAFQQARGLFADGIVGPDTWRSLIEAGVKLGDRVLYLSQPYLRGDDVRELQDRLDRIGVDVGPRDGILGPDSATAITEFQLMQGLKVDGQAGAITIAALHRVGRRHQSVSAAEVRERHRLGRRRVLPSLAGSTVVVDPGKSPERPGHVNPDGVFEHEITWAIASRLHGRLAALGARPVLARGPANSPSSSARAALANRENADVVLSIHTNGLDSTAAHGVASYYFGIPSATSTAGQELAELAVDGLAAALATPHCRAHPSNATLFREARAVTVAVEVGFLTHPDEGRLLARDDHQSRITDVLVDALHTYLLGLAPPTHVQPRPVGRQAV